jgi:phage portal protein BeeE
MENPNIAYHTKNDHHGWYEVCIHPADWHGWHDFDRSMIDELLREGHTVVTCGWNMYEVVQEVRHG